MKCVAVGLFLQETECILIYVFEKLVIPLFVLHKACCMLIFLLVKLVLVLFMEPVA